MADSLLQETYSELLTETSESLLLESSLPVMTNNYRFIDVKGDGMSVTEKFR